MAEHDENDERDSGTSKTGGVAGPVTDPPTLPPFADGPRPATIHGFPKVDVFGSGDGVDDLFDVPKLGAKPPSNPTKIAPPPVAPLPPRKGPPTGPLPTIPPVGTSDRNAPLAREADPGPRMHAIDTPGVPTELPDESPSGTLPPANSLIEKIRAAKRKADAGSGDDAKPSPGAAPKLPPIKPLAASKKPAAAKPAKPETAPPAEAAKVEAAEPEPAKPDPAIAAEPEVADVEAAKPEPTPAPEPAKPKLSASPSKPRRAPPAPPTTGSAPSDDAKAWLEPVPLKSLDRRTEIGTDVSSSETPPAADADASSSEIPPAASTDTPADAIDSAATTTEPEPSPSEAAPSDDEQTIALTHKPVAPPPPSTGPLAPPPPSTTIGPDGDDQPRVGVPYVPPAVVIRHDETLDDEIADEHEVVTAAPEPPRPARLPLPGSRLPPADPVIAARLAQVAAEQPTSVPIGVPQMVAQQDTASLVDGLANELIAEAESEQAVTLRAKIPAANEPPRPDDRRRKFALGAIGVGILLSILALVLPGGDAEEASLVPDIEQPESKQPDPTLAQIEAEPEPEPTPTPVEPPPEPETNAETETGGEAEPPPEPEPEPEPALAPKSDANKPAPGPKRRDKKSEPEPEPKPAPKPDPKPSTSTTDNRSADDLYKAAQTAYRSGRASEAYKLASDSYRKSSKSKTAELMTLAACKLRDTSKARSALSKVTAIKRGGVKKDCKAMGVEL